MKIFLSWLQGERRPNIPAFEFWHPYIRRGLAEAAVDVVEDPAIDWIEGLVTEVDGLEAWKSRVWTRVVDAINVMSRKPDVFLSYLSPRQIDVSAIREISRLGVATVNFYCDNIRDFMTVPDEFSAYDINWVPEFAARQMYRRRSLKILPRPMPVAVADEFRTDSAPEVFPPTFIGSFDVQRRALFEQLAQANIPFDIRGAGWSKEKRAVALESPSVSAISRLRDQVGFIRRYGLLPFVRKVRVPKKWNESSNELQKHVRPFPSDAEYLAILRESVVAIGISRVPSFLRPFNAPLSYSRLRDLEAPMVGSCYLTEATPGLDELYEVGKEIETYRNGEELFEKIQALVGDKKRRYMLRRNGQKRALTDHTVKKTIADLKAMI